MTIWVPILPPSRPRYLALVEALAADLAAGRLADGARLPTQRELARALGVSLGTVTRAYSLAESRGLVHGEVGRGTFVGRAAAAELPLDDSGAERGDAIGLGMTWPLDAENPDLAPALRRLARRTDLAELLTYAPNAGRRRHREAGAAWIAHHGLDVDPERILVCAGAQHAMTVVVATLLRPGDTLLTESLTYPGVRAVAELLGCRLQGLALDEEGIVPDALDAACRGRGKRPRVLYTVPTLQNPTTATQSEGRRRALAELARRHDLSIVEDAIHHLLARDVPPLLATFAPERTFLIASPSKVVAGGLRVAWLAAPADAIRRLTHNVWATNWMAAPLNAELLATWIEDGTAVATVERKQAEAAARARLAGACLRGRLEGLEHGGGARLLLPPTTYHAWLELPPGWTDGRAFAAAAERRGVVVTPAEAFVASGRAPAGVRISLSAPRTHDALRRGLERVAGALADGPRIAAENARAGTAIV